MSIGSGGGSGGRLTSPIRPSTSNQPRPNSFAPLLHTHTERQILDLDKYKKSETYSKTEINALIHNITQGIKWEPVHVDVPAAGSGLGYIADHVTPSTRLKVTLPVAAPQGYHFAVTTGANTGGWEVAKASGQLIQHDGSQTSLGPTGKIQSTLPGDSAELVCIVRDTTWNVVASNGTLFLS